MSTADEEETEHLGKTGLPVQAHWEHSIPSLPESADQVELVSGDLCSAAASFGMLEGALASAFQMGAPELTCGGTSSASG